MRLPCSEVVSDPLLHRYWLEFDRTGSAESLAGRGLLLGCGVTAFSPEDATQLVHACIFGQASMPAVVRIIEDVDITTLDAGHVLPNMTEPVSRGIWYPSGYRSSGGTS